MNGLLILAGGKATRLKNKPFVKFNGIPMLKIVYDELSGLFDEIAISARSRKNENERPSYCSSLKTSAKSPY